MSTRNPAVARHEAALEPSRPEPITTTSLSLISVIAPPSARDCIALSTLARHAHNVA
jgi:hypothetical protein